MRVLITGGLGFIGGHLIKKLEAKGHEIHILDRIRITMERYYRGDITDYYSLESIFEKTRPEVVVHLAATVSRKECEETPAMAILTNVDGTFNVCALAHKYGARVIYGGSSEEYGTALGSNRVVNEDTPFGRPTGIYSMTKRMSEEVVQYFAHFKGLNATTVRFFMLYGPGEEPSNYRSALIRFIYSAIKNEPLIVHKGTERAWCYIGDAIDALTLIIERNQEENYEVFNIGREEPIPTEVLAEKIVKMLNSSSDIIKIDVEPTIIPVKRASFKKIKRILGWEAKTSLDEGLKQVSEWMKEYIKSKGY